MDPATLILIRHGDTNGNDSGHNAYVHGVTDLPLSPLGKRQAQALARRLRGEPSACAVYASSLRRAMETARMVSPPTVPVRGVDDLREIDCGEVDGMPVAEAARRFPEAWMANDRQDDDDFRWPGGESYRELRARSIDVVRQVAAAHAGERVFLVTHAGVISQIMGVLHGTRAARWELFRPGTGSITVVKWSPRGGELVNFDDRAHLGPRGDPALL